MNIQSFEDLKKAILYASHESGEEGWHDLEDMITIKREGDLLMFSYTNECNYKPPQEWTWLEKVSRGLIMNAKTGEIVARPFEKFWNLNFDLQPYWKDIEGIYEKVDGSLGIIYYWDGKWRVSTRGSFNSKQAIWAQNFIDAHVRFNSSHLSEEDTILVEIVYPENIVVVDYGAFEGLVLLDVLDKNGVSKIGKGFSTLNNIAMDMNIIASVSYTFYTHHKLLESLEERDGSEVEGYVIRMKDGTRWKVKSEEYVRLHSIISNFRLKKVLELIQSEDYEKRREELMSICPEYYKDIFRKYERFIVNTVELTKLQVKLYMNNAPKSDRKEFALWVNHDNNFVSKSCRPYMFAAYDNKDITPLIYKNAFNYTEEEIRERLGITGDTGFNNG